MSIRYDENTKARAVRLVREHRDDYHSEWAAMKAISGRLGMNPETLRKWVRQAEIDAGEAAGVSSEERRELRELRRRCRELKSDYRNPQGRNKFLRAGVRPATPLICPVHRRAQGHVRGRTDLPGTGRARRADRPAHLLGALLVGAVEKGAVGHHDHRDPGRLRRTRRRRETPAGEPVRQPEDVGAPAAPGHPGGAAHGGTDHAGTTAGAG